jgi:small redox-active disulfide protein 2
MMVTVKVLGSGCANCKRLEAMVQKVAAGKTFPVQIEHVTDYQAIMAYRIMSTPGLVINETVKSAGRIPSDADISAWLDAAAT